MQLLLAQFNKQPENLCITRCVHEVFSVKYITPVNEAYKLIADQFIGVINDLYFQRFSLNTQSLVALRQKGVEQTGMPSENEYPISS